MSEQMSAMEHENDISHAKKGESELLMSQNDLVLSHSALYFALNHPS